MKTQRTELGDAPERGSYRWIAVAVFCLFMVLHQADKLLITPLVTPIMSTFNINEAEMGAVFTGALLVQTAFYPLWGYLFDRYGRAKLLALTSLIWGATTWLSAIAPTYPTFVASRASTGIDDSSYPGLFSLISDYFAPRTRGKVLGLLHLMHPVGYVLGLLGAAVLSEVTGWRGVFYVTGGLGVLMAVLIYFGVREPPRGGGEPELARAEGVERRHFSWATALALLRRRTVVLLWLQGIFAVAPWNVIVYWGFRYLEERGGSSDAALASMLPTVGMMALGYYLGGAVGDLLFRRSRRGRVAVALTSEVVGVVLLVGALHVPTDNPVLFQVLLMLTGLAIPWPAANVLATLGETTLPEVRSMALAVHRFIENAGAALAPWIAGLIAVGSSLRDAILIVCGVGWLISAAVLCYVTWIVPRDIAAVREAIASQAGGE